MLLLSDLVRKTIVSSGQITIPIAVFGYDEYKLIDIFRISLGEYEKQRPLKKTATLALDVIGEGYSIDNVIRVLNVRPAIESFQEYAKPLDFQMWELNEDKLKLKTNYGGKFYIEYLAKYNINYHRIFKQIKYITSFEDKIRFLVAPFTKGTLAISLTDINSNVAYNVTDDVSSYEQYQANFTVDVVNNYLIIPESIGKKMKTGSKLSLTTSTTLPSPLNVNNSYFVIKVSDINIRLATSYNNAFNNVFIDITNSGSGTHSFLTNSLQPEINLIGTLGSGTYNLETKEVELSFSQSFNGFLNIEFLSNEIGALEMDENDPYFLELFKANFMISLGYNKSILKLDGLPWDFSVDSLIAEGQNLRDKILEKITSKNKWYLFR